MTKTYRKINDCYIRANQYLSKISNDTLPKLSLITPEIKYLPRENMTCIFSDNVETILNGIMKKIMEIINDTSLIGTNLEKAFDLILKNVVKKRMELELEKNYKRTKSKVLFII